MRLRRTASFIEPGVNKMAIGCSASLTGVGTCHALWRLRVGNRLSATVHVVERPRDPQACEPLLHARHAEVLVMSLRSNTGRKHTRELGDGAADALIAGRGTRSRVEMATLPFKGKRTVVWSHGRRGGGGEDAADARVVCV